MEITERKVNEEGRGCMDKVFAIKMVGEECCER